MHNLQIHALSEGRSRQCPLPFISLPHVFCTSPDQRGSRSSCDQPPFCPPVHAAPALPLWVTTPDPPAKESMGEGRVQWGEVPGAGSMAPFLGKPGVGDRGSRLALPGSTPAPFPFLGCYRRRHLVSSATYCLCPSRPHRLREPAWVCLCRQTLGSSSLSFMCSSPFPGRLAGEVGADGWPVIERATCPTPPPPRYLGLQPRSLD